ncbi:RNA polymerase sigma factor [Sphingobacterium suaedae]|uniref:RNA polymerase sigma factor n=1 Tax=Sphingobacterium suaedae TaxID=1686402 RepID=A0ABW5KMX5_9SPHI
MDRTVSKNGSPKFFGKTFIVELRKATANKSLNQLFEHYWQPLFQFSYNILKDDDDAKDAVQDVFITLWNRRFDIDIHTSMESYLFTAVRYRSLTILSKKLDLKQRNVPLENYIESSFTESVDPFVLKDLQQEIDRQIETLPTRMQEVIRLKIKDSLSISEIAARLNISEDTVKNHLAAARSRLRSSLGDVAYFILVITLSSAS